MTQQAKQVGEAGRTSAHLERCARQSIGNVPRDPRGPGCCGRSFGEDPRARAWSLIFSIWRSVDLPSFLQELVAPPEFTARVRDALLRVAEEKTGVKHSIDEKGDSGKLEDFHSVGGVFTMLYLLFEDQVFEEWLENPVLGALVNYALRGQARLSALVSILKWKDESQLDSDIVDNALHSDSPRWPDGNLLDGGNLMVNSAYILTDYSKEDGAIAMVPGSHKLGRLPYPGEAVKDMVPVEAPAGSLIFWKGSTWHGGAYPKLTDGLRLVLNGTFFNRSLKTVEQYQRAVPKEVLDRRNRQFALFVGADDMSGFGPEGPQPAYLEPNSFF